MDRETRVPGLENEGTGMSKDNNSSMFHWKSFSFLSFSLFFVPEEKIWKRTGHSFSRVVNLDFAPAAGSPSPLPAVHEEREQRAEGRS